MDKRKQLVNVLDALAGLAELWNESAADDDRGRDNAMLVLALWEDGSGRIGTAHDYDRQTGRFITLSINTQQVFENTEHAADYLLEWTEHSENWDA